MNKKIPVEDMIQLIAESIQEGKEVAFTPSGTSMEPTLSDQQDIVYLSAPEKLKKYDICLYYNQGKYSLHRIVKIQHNNQYTMCGDHNVVLEKNIQKDQIIAKVSRYIHQHQEISVNQKKFYRKGFVSYHLRFMRKLKRRIIRHGATH